jgi:hypothetical protein
VHLAKALTPRGIAVGRFDRRGDNVPLDEQADDALAFVRELGGRPDIDRRRIGLWGFSQGAWVAPLAASRSSDVAFLVLVASVGVSPAAQMRYGAAKHARMAGHADDASARIVSVRDVVDEWRRGRVSIERAQAAIDGISDEAWFEHAYLPARIDPAKTWPDMDFDPEPVFERVRVPVLLFYGEDDEWAPVEESIRAWRRAAERGGNREVTIVRLAGTGHAPTREGREELDAIAPEYEATLIDWLKGVTHPD